MKSLAIAITLSALLAGCARVQSVIETIIEPETAAELSIVEINPHQEIILGTFDLDRFGPKKAGDLKILGLLANIIHQFDVVAVQEIHDQSGEAPIALLNAVNAFGEVYGMVLSPRTGQQANDSEGNAQEQYAFFYRMRTISHLGNDLLFPDEERDLFQHEPHMARFGSNHGNLTFVLINIHTDPNLAIQEIDALHDAVEWARSHFLMEDDFIVLGNFNAACDYAGVEDLRSTRLRRLSYAWIVQDEDDTNVADSVCAYDRIVLNENAYRELTGGPMILRVFDDPAVSDHWPVMVTLGPTENMDMTTSSNNLE